MLGSQDGAPLNICHQLCVLNRHWSKTSVKLLNTLNRNDHAFAASPAPALTNAQASRTCRVTSDLQAFLHALRLPLP